MAAARHAQHAAAAAPSSHCSKCALQVVPSNSKEARPLQPLHVHCLTLQAQRSARLSGGSDSEAATLASPRRGSSGLDARPWEIAFEELHIHRAIGEGSFGKVSGCRLG